MKTVNTMNGYCVQAKFREVLKEAGKSVYIRAAGLTHKIKKKNAYLLNIRSPKSGISKVRNFLTCPCRKIRSEH